MASTRGVWGPSWLQVGGSGAILAPSWGVRGASWLQVGGSGGHLGAKSRNDLQRSLRGPPPGTRFLRHLPRGLLIFTSGRKGTQVIPRHPGTLLGGSGKATLEAKLEDLGAILGGLGSQVGGLEANLGASWSQLGRFRCQLGGLGGNFTRFGGFYKNLKKQFVFIVFLSIGGSSWRLLDAKLASSRPS